MKTAIRVALLAALCTLAITAQAQTVTLKGDLKGSNEVPPNNTTATGNAEAVFDPATRRLSWTVNYSGLSGPVTGMHFHGPAEAGRNAGIALPFQAPPGGFTSPVTGSQVINEAQANDLLAGRWYANIHTAANPGGEVRGQMVK